MVLEWHVGFVQGISGIDLGTSNSVMLDLLTVYRSGVCRTDIVNISEYHIFSQYFFVPTYKRESVIHISSFIIGAKVYGLF